MIGDPIDHSRSPAIFNAAFDAAGLDWALVALRVPAGAAASALRAARELDLAALCVTMPHKSEAAVACDTLTETAATLGAVNLVVVRDGRLIGDSTDGEGFVASVREEGIEPSGRGFLVLGAGGAARAIVLALGAAGASVTVAARRLEMAEAAAALAPGGRAAAWSDRARNAKDVDVVVNVTPVGMAHDGTPIDVEALRADQVVVDTIYHPDETALLAGARARGLRGVNGLGMLVHQAGSSFERMTGHVAPLDAMRSGARA